MKRSVGNHLCVSIPDRVLGCFRPKCLELVRTSGEVSIPDRVLGCFRRNIARRLAEENEIEGFNP